MLALTNAKVLTVTNGVIENGTVLVDHGKITAVGSDVVVPDGAQVVDATGKWVTPGLIDAHSHMTVKGEPAWGGSVSDITEITSPITPGVRAMDAVNPHDWSVPLVRAAGFTTVAVLPGSGNLISGQTAVFKLKEAATVLDLLVEDAPIQIKFAFGENPKRIHGQQQKHAPLTRLGNALMVREFLAKAVEYSDALAAAERGEGARPARDLHLEALVPVVRGERTCRIHSHRADDIVTATRVAEEFGLRYIIDHATEAWKISDYLKEKDVTCIVGPMNMELDKQEVWERRIDQPALLEAAGITFCLTQDARSGTRFLPAFVGIAIAHGLSFETALRAVTINPATVLGIDHRTGSIEVGKDADLAVFSGNPFNSMSKCEHTIIEGVLY